MLASAEQLLIVLVPHSGKDRTGLICALVLACCGVSEGEIIQNYQESEKYLSPVMERIQVLSEPLLLVPSPTAHLYSSCPGGECVERLRFKF